MKTLLITLIASLLTLPACGPRVIFTPQLNPPVVANPPDNPSNPDEEPSTCPKKDKRHPREEDLIERSIGFLDGCRRAGASAQRCSELVGKYQDQLLEVMSED